MTTSDPQQILDKIKDRGIPSRSQAEAALREELGGASPEI